MLSICVVLALALRALASARSAVIFNDGPTFLALARAFAHGEFAAALGHPFHPLYPISIALLHRLFSLPEGDALLLTAKTVSVFSGGLAVACLWSWLRSAFGRRAAAVGALALAVHPGAVGLSADVQSDGLYLALFLAAVAALWRALVSNSAWRAGAAGALSGLAYLTRPEGLGVVVVGASIGVWFAGMSATGERLLAAARARASEPGSAAKRPTSRTGRWQRVSWMLALVGCAAGVIAPYAGWLTHESGTFTLTRKKTATQITGLGGASVWGAGEIAPAPPPSPLRDTGSRLHDTGETSPDATGVAADEADRTGSQPAAGVALESRALRSDPRRATPARDLATSAPPSRTPEPPRSVGSAFVDLVRTLVRAARPDVLVLLLAGFWSRRGGTSLRGVFVAAFAAFHGLLLAGLAVFSGYVSARHALPPIVLGFGWLGYGAERFGSSMLDGFVRVRARAPDGELPGRSPWLATAIGVALILVLGLGHALRPHRDEGLAERRAAEWLRRTDTGTSAVAVEKSRNAWYAGRAFVPLRDAPDERTGEWLRARGATFVILDADALERRPALARALAREARLLHREIDGDVEARIFALRDGSADANPAVSTAPEGR